ncbi:MAG: amidohydrolase [Clostridia bacterium]|nr:amidohydrolase [Clostridia bacterium]
MLKEYFDIVEQNKDKIYEVCDSLYDDPETSFEEYHAVELLKNILRSEGFLITSDLVGMDTAFSATFGEGYPHIGVLSEYDGLPGMSQVGEIGECKSIEGLDKNHSCGHNLYAGGSLGAVLAIKEYIKKNKKGRVTFFGCPAEEAGAGKVYMARDGVFSDVDAVLSWHPESMYMVRTRPSLACIKSDYEFTGIASHAGANPDKGRSALDAVELMNVGVNFLREHMPLSARIHYSILDAGGRAPNIVQSHASVRYMIRANTIEEVRALKERVDKCAMGASLMTETQWTDKVISGYSSLVTIPTLQKLADEVMREAELPVATKEELEYGKKLQESMQLTLEQKALPIFANVVKEPAPPAAHGGSTDTADVSWVCPAVQMHIGNWVTGTPGHSWQSCSQSRGSYAKRATVYASKALAGIAIRLFENPDILLKAKEEHKAKTINGYDCPIPKEVKPSIE